MVYFPLKRMGVCGFYIAGQLLHALKVSFYNPFASYSHGFVILAHVDDRKAIQMRAKQPVKERLLHYYLTIQPFLIYPQASL